MKESSISLPVYLRLSQIIMGLLALFYILFIGQAIIVPLIFSIIISILLNPLVNFMMNKGIGKTVSILIAILISLLILSGIFYFLISQVSMFSEAAPMFKSKFSQLIDQMIKWISNTFNIEEKKIFEWIKRTKGEGMGNSTAMVGQTIGTVGNVLAYLFLLPVYVFMFLFYKPLLLEFIARLFKEEQHATVAEVLVDTKSLIQSYLIGLMVEALLVATLNTAGLLIIGIDYAILLGVIGALLNLIPYIGGLIAISLPMIIALATKSPVHALYVFIVYIIVQFIDNNLIVPRIVASRVKINALISIVVVLIGGALWGVSGMFLSIPLTAIIKVIFDRIQPLKAFGFLLGDNQPEIGKAVFDFNTYTRKLKRSSKPKK